VVLTFVAELRSPAAEASRSTSRTRSSRTVLRSCRRIASNSPHGHSRRPWHCRAAPAPSLKTTWTAIWLLAATSGCHSSRFLETGRATGRALRAERNCGLDAAGHRECAGDRGTTCADVELLEDVLDASCRRLS